MEKFKTKKLTNRNRTETKTVKTELAAPMVAQIQDTAVNEAFNNSF